MKSRMLKLALASLLLSPIVSILIMYAQTTYKPHPVTSFRTGLILDDGAWYNMSSGQAIDKTIPIVGGVPPYTCTLEQYLDDGVTPSKLPPGLVMTSNCHIQGVIQVNTGQYKFRYSVKDATGMAVKVP